MKKALNNIHLYSRGIIIPIILLLSILAVGVLDAGAESGTFQKNMNATIQTIITLENGHSYIVSEKETKVTVNTYNLSNPEFWEIARW